LAAISGTLLINSVRLPLCRALNAELSSRPSCGRVPVVHGQFLRGRAAVRAGGFVVAGCAAQEWPPKSAELASGALLSRLEHGEIRFELLRQ